MCATTGLCLASATRGLPLFFPGGDIGSLAINGTVNDLAMCGAKPLYLSAGFILEEGMETDKLWRIVNSMRSAADAASVQLVTGDTKVVDRGKGDEIFVNTAGVGVIEHDLSISPASVRPGDAVILSGDIGRHGIAIFETTVESDFAPLSSTVEALIDAGIEIHCMRDLTRGGLASALVEIAEASGFEINVAEEKILVREDVKGACEILGFDPMYLANEGRFVAFVPANEADRAIEVMNSFAAKYSVSEHRYCRGGQIRRSFDETLDRGKPDRRHVLRRTTPSHLLGI